jgi:hypothetical protein
MRKKEASVRKNPHKSTRRMIQKPKRTKRVRQKKLRINQNFGRVFPGKTHRVHHKPPK